MPGMKKEKESEATKKARRIGRLGGLAYVRNHDLAALSANGRKAALARWGKAKGKKNDTRK